MRAIPTMLSVLLFVALSTAAGAAPLNVLFIMADDLRPELGAFGSPALTPNLDRLAARGVRFERAYCQQALCNPSRSSLLTGRRPDTLEVWSNETHFRDRNPDVATLPGWFKAQGYTSRCVGKIFHNWHTKVRGDPGSWSAPEFLHFATHGDDVPKVAGIVPPNLAVHSPHDYGRVPLDDCRDVPDEATFDGRVAAEAVRVLGELGPRPFFLAVGFWKPHAPFNAPKRYWDRYERERLPPLDPAWPLDAPRIAAHDSTEILGPLPQQRPLTPDQVAEMRHGYYAAVTFMDALVGKLLDALDRSGRSADTLVVFVSDHGFHLGEHGLWAKTSTFELDARVPLVISVPEAARAGAATQAIVELVDLFPTLVEACGLPAPAGLEGVSLVPLLEGTVDAVKPAAFTQHPRPAYYERASAKRPDAMGVSVRTKHVRYTEWRDWATGETLAGELYDHAADPAELVNRLSEPALAAERKGAAELLAARFPRTAHPAPSAR